MRSLTQFFRLILAAVWLIWPGTQAAAALDYKADRFDDIQVLSYFPPKYKGIIYFLHGRGGSSAEFSRTAGAMVSEAVQRSYAVVFLESANRALGTWRPTRDPNRSIDIQNIGKVRALLAQRGLLGGATPEFAVGFSSGGGFAPYAAQVFGFKAVAVFNARGYESLLASALYNRPTIFFPGEDDAVASPREVAANYELLLRRGIPAALAVVPREGHRFTAKRSADLFSFFDKYADAGFAKQ